MCVRRLPAISQLQAPHCLWWEGDQVLVFGLAMHVEIVKRVFERVVRHVSQRLVKP